MLALASELEFTVRLAQSLGYECGLRVPYLPDIYKPLRIRRNYGIDLFWKKIYRYYLILLISYKLMEK